MNGYDDLIRRATNRLEVDPELQLDVAQELRGHLEDSAAEFIDGGYSPDEAAASAAKALGDPDELAEKLLAANRFRMRIRGLLRWTARLALLPAAIAVVVMIGIGMGTPGHQLGGNWPKGVASIRLTEEQRFILLGDPNAMGQGQAAKSISNRWPDNPIYYGNYLVKSHALSLDDRQIEEDPGCIDKALSLLERGRRIDPDNAFYDYMSAALLLKSAGELSEDETRPYEIIERDGAVREKYPYELDITDPERFARVLAEFRNGLVKSECSGRSIEMMDLRLGILPQPERMSDLLRRTFLQVSTPLPPLNEHRNLAKALCAHAIVLAESGDPNAIELVRSVRVYALQLGSRSRTLIELLVARAIENLAVEHAQFVYEELGQTQMAAEARHQSAEFTREFNEITSPQSKDVDSAQASMLGAVLTPTLSGYEIDHGPMRRAELAFWMQVGLVLLLGLLVLSIPLISVRWLLGQSFGSKALLVFVGWGRIGKICLWSVVVPLGIYGAYAYWQIASPNAYGLSYTFGRVCLEMAVVVVGVFTLLRAMSYSAIRRRAEELGLEVPPPIRFRNRAVMGSIGILLLLASVAYVAGWWAGPLRPSEGNWEALWADSFSSSASSTMPSPVGVWLAGVVLAFPLMWGLRNLLANFLGRGKYKAFAQTFRRSLVPILASGVIVVGIICGGLLAWTEVAAVKSIEGGVIVSLRREIDKSDFRLIQERHRAEYKTRLKELSADR